MALVQAKAPDPELALVAALKEYEKVLTVADKQQLHAQTSLDVDSAVKFTALVDSQSGGRRAQCMGPRLMMFLESVQQFSQVVDTFVSSHPEVAGLVWGGVKLALLVCKSEQLSHSLPGYITKDVVCGL